MKVIKADAKGVQTAVNYLRQGKSVVYPTDTAYGLGVDATNPDAVEQMYSIKNRKKDQPVHIVASSLSMARKYGRFDKKLQKVFKKFMPGPLTLVVELRNRRKRNSRKALELLSAGTGTIGIRMPDNHVALAISRRLGVPITTSSANPKGKAVPYTIEEVKNQFENRKNQPDLLLDAGKLPETEPSTLASIKNGKVDLIRKGPVTKKEIEDYIN